MTEHRSPARQLACFAAVGVACGSLFALQFVLLRFAGLSAVAANIAATLSTTVVGSAADRRISFGVRGSAARLRHLVQAGLLTIAALAVSSTILGLLTRHSLTLSTVEELAIASGIGLITGIIRFQLLRHWVYRPGPPQAQHKRNSTPSCAANTSQPTPAAMR